MLLKTVFPHFRHFRVDSLITEEQKITLVCVSTRKHAHRPSCQQISRRALRSLMKQDRKKEKRAV